MGKIISLWIVSQLLVNGVWGLIFFQSMLPLPFKLLIGLGVGCSAIFIVTHSIDYLHQHWEDGL